MRLVSQARDILQGRDGRVGTGSEDSWEFGTGPFSQKSHFKIFVIDCQLLISVRRWSWARWVSLVLAVLDLLLIPVGTLFGIYAIWVLMQDETEAMFA